MSLTSSRRALEVYVIIHRDGGQRSDHIQSGTTGADRTAHDGGRARGGGSDNEGGGGILLQHDVGAGLRESFGSVPLNIDNTSALHIAGNCTYSPRAKHRAEALFFRARTGGGGQGQHPLRQERGSAGTWAPSAIVSTVTATSSSASTSLRLEPPTSSSTTKGRPSSFCARNTCVLLVIFSVLRSYLQRCTHTALLFRSR